MTVTQEPTVLRRRRTVEGGAFLSRGSGLAVTAMFVAGWLGRPPGAPIEPTVRTVCLIGVALMAVANILALINLWRPGGSQYRTLSATQVTLDTIATGGIVVAIQAYTPQITWPLLAVPVVVAALRMGLSGSLIAWAVTSGWLVTSAYLLEVRDMSPGDLTMAVLVNLLIAVLTGIQARAHDRQLKELEAVRRQLHHQATHDPLTGLPNRKYLATYAEELDCRAMAVLLLDLNGFKQVNDTLGHAAGDELLRELSRRLGATLREGDLAGRLGGDEFVVVLPDTGPALTDRLADRLRTDICRPVDLAEGPVSVGVSIGAAHRAAGEDTDLARLMMTADAAMYREKAGRDAALAVPPGWALPVPPG